jgi:arylsulfatase A
VTLLLAGLLAMSALISGSHVRAAEAGQQKPNIVFILADDLGYGDVQCLNPGRGKIPTPNLDRLAAQGVAFTDAHSSSAVCTPTRYGILTGRYNWRSHLQHGVLGVYASPLIAADRLTVPALLKQEGYVTACVGKWHLGWDWPRAGGGKGNVPDFSQPIAGGPTTRGFDRYFGTDVPNYPPYCFIENDRTVGLPSVPLPKRLFEKNMASQPGPSVPGWSLEAILPTLADKAGEFIREQQKGGRPFFLYLPLTSPHTPLAVTAEWSGKSGLGRYADFVMETDAMIGRVLGAIDEGTAGNTLVFFASDNGCAPYVGVGEMEAKGHYPSADRRGYKADAWDGGHRIPFMVRWPGVTKPGSRCNQLVCLNDLMATCADLLSVKVPDTAGEDSISILPLLRGENRPVREAVVHHSIAGKFAIRDGRWKLILCAGSGGWGSPKDVEAIKRGLPAVQLYDMTSDVAEEKNVQAEHPDVVARLTQLLEKYVTEGRSTLGAPQKNDAAVDFRKRGT